MNSTALFQAMKSSSWLHRTDARVKLTLTVGTILTALLYQNLWFLLGLFGLQLLLYISANLPLGQFRSTLLALLPVSLLMTLLRWFFYPLGPVLAQLGPLTLTLGGLAAGLVVGTRIVTLALAVVIWLSTTSNQDLIRSLVSLGLPYSWGLSFSLALRFLPEFFQTYLSIEQAQHARGLDFSDASLLQQVRGRQPILIAMLISSLRRSEQMAIALEARAFGSPGHDRTDYRPLRMKSSDWLLLAAILLGFTLLLVIRFGFGIGSHPL